MKKTILILVMLSLFSLFILSGCKSGKNNIGPHGSAHIHSDFKLYILGKHINFNNPKYQVMEDLTHVENRDGDVIHLHATGITLGYFFKSLGLKLESECVTLDTGNTYCNKGNAELKVFVKSANTDWDAIFYPTDYIIQELDKILVTYGTEDEEYIKKQLESVTDKAVIT